MSSYVISFSWGRHSTSSNGTQKKKIFSALAKVQLPQMKPWQHKAESYGDTEATSQGDCKSPEFHCLCGSSPQQTHHSLISQKSGPGAEPQFADY